LKILSITTGLAVATTVVAISVAGCSGNKPSTATSATSSASSAASPAGTTTPSSAAQAQPTDYTGLLIRTTDITAPGAAFTSQPPVPNPNGKPGAAIVFADQNDAHEIRDTILILPDAAGAAAALDDAKAALGNSVTGGTPQPATVGSGGTMVAGNPPDGTKSVAVLLFTEGKAFATLEFDSGPNDMAPSEFVADVGQKQDTAIKNGLPG
jgi:hypothetical protein